LLRDLEREDPAVPDRPATWNERLLPCPTNHGEHQPVRTPA